MVRTTTRKSPPIVTAALLVALASTVGAINIDFVVDLPQNFPSFDPDGQGLQTVGDAAEQIWQKLRPGGGSYSFSIHWEAFGVGNELAIANGFDNTIRFNSDYDWFIDMTPLENEEFGNFNSLFYRDATSGQKSDWFVGPVPDMLEYSYRANAFGGSPAAGKYDLLTVMLHEMGHLTGVSWNLLAPDVGINADWVGFRGGVAVHRRNEAHIDPEGALMDPDTAPGTRTLPSALDVMVNAHEKGAPKSTWTASSTSATH